MDKNNTKPERTRSLYVLLNLNRTAINVVSRLVESFRVGVVPMSVRCDALIRELLCLTA